MNEDTLNEDTQTADTLSPTLPEGDYAVIEIMGHRTRWGRIEEVERFGAKFLRVHSLDGEGLPLVEDYAAPAIFSVQQVPRVAVEAHNERQSRRRAQEEAWRDTARSRMLSLDCRDDEDVPAGGLRAEDGDQDAFGPEDFLPDDRISLTEEGLDAQRVQSDAP